MKYKIINHYVGVIFETENKKDYLDVLYGWLHDIKHIFNETPSVKQTIVNNLLTKEIFRPCDLK